MLEGYVESDDVESDDVESDDVKSDDVESDMVGGPVESYTSRKAKRFENLDLPVNCLQDEVDEDDAHGIEVLWEDPINHPQCPHGPTLLFTRCVKGDVKKYYGCSAYRDRKSCTFFLRFGQEMPKLQKHQWKLERQKLAQHYDHQQLYVHFDKLMTRPVSQRCYCHRCEKLIFNFEKNRKHKVHKITENVTGYQMHHPTELLQPLENEKKEAQYLFSKKTTEDIVNMLLKLGAKQILCIGTPRIHEYIKGHHKHKMSSLLLDIDGRFHNFFGPMDYCWYNLFNHHFFNNDAVSVFKNFLTKNEGKDTYVICDPPFDGPLEPISYTMKTISDLHKKLNKQISNDDFFLKIMFIYPYYMESVMKNSPPHVTGGLKDLKMSDYKVDYDNYPTFTSKENGTEQGSLVRIFTNIPLNLLKLPSSNGYKFCRKCNIRFSSENDYSNKCKECTSNSSQTVKYCDLCRRHVKPTWVHCQICQRCESKEHTCDSKPLEKNFWRKCLICNRQDHTYKQCTKLLNLLPTETTTDCETNIKKSNIDCYLKTSSNEKTKVKHPKKVIKQKAVIDDKESLKTEKDKNLKSKSHNK